jgi:E3 ubiquitin-protein ligase HUWE1
MSTIVTLPCIPYNYGSTVASDSLVQILRTMTEVAPALTMSKVISHVRAALDETRNFWSSTGGESKLVRYVELSSKSTIQLTCMLIIVISFH